MPGTRRRPGRMGPFIESYREGLTSLGYTPTTVRGLLKDAGRLGRWMAEREIELEHLNEAAVETFVTEQRLAGHQIRTVRSYAQLLGHLRSVGAAPPAPDAVPLSPLLAEFRVWMVEERGLAPLTVLRYENFAVRFLDWWAGRCLVSLTGKDVTDFLLAESARLSVGSAKGRVAEMRALLRFFFVTGRTERALAVSVPPVAGWHDVTVPRGISIVDVERLLASCDRATVTGARDFAVLTVVARLGLRSAEVARLELDDIDWRAGEIVVRGKARRVDRLPLPDEVGRALVAWLEARPAVEFRQVFLTVKAPIGPIRPDRVTGIARLACGRAGVAQVGAHRLRHALATEMLRRGASLVEVGQILRHSDIATTAVYAKVDITTLRRLAQPWPGGRA